MNDIRAFVGHSFNKMDEGIVGKFLKYLDRLTNLHPSFSWANAESAEPKELARKVLSLMEGKNVFIGICTKREAAIAEESLSMPLLQPSYRKGKQTDFEWKTTDWIIQEIGFAKGRGMELVLLIEKGVRRPGGLQGDIEYIEFTRDNLEEAFTKLLEMITALTPRISEAPIVSQKPNTGAPEFQKQVVDGGRPEWTIPKSDWTRDQYESALFCVVLMDDAAAADQISEAYLATLSASQEDDSIAWKAYVEHLRLAYNKGGNIDVLRAIAVASPHNDRVLEYLGTVSARYDEHAESAKLYESAAAEISEPDRKAHLLGLATEQHALAEELDEVTHIIGEIKAAHEKGEISELSVLETMRRLAEIGKDEETSIVIMERIVELKPGDSYTRFALAYKHYERENKDLALHHYLRIPPQDRNAVTWNNIGVALDHLRLRGMAVRSYRKAKEMGETLAMSNLAQKLMRAGFMDEAQAECDQAILVKDYHPSVLDVLKRLREIPEEERKNQDEALEKAKPKIEFYKAVARVIASPEPSVLAPAWQGPDCVLSLQLAGRHVSIIGEYERDANPLGISAGIGLLGAVRYTTKFKVEYSGKLVGNAIIASVSRTRDRNATVAASLLELAGDKAEVLMIFSSDHSEIRVLEDSHGTFPTYYAFKRLDA